MPTPADALAVLRDGTRYEPARPDRPVLLRLDAGHYDGLTVEIPGPRVLAKTWALPMLRESLDLRRSGSAILTRPRDVEVVPEPVALADLRARLRDALGALPERDDAGRPYRDLRLLAEVANPGTVSAYLDDVLRYARASLTPWRPTREAGPRPPAKTGAERESARRERNRAAEEDSSAWAVRGWHEAWGDDEAEGPEPGSRVRSSEVYAAAREAVGNAVEEHDGVREDVHLGRAEEDEWERVAEEDGFPLHPRVPGRSTFYAVADRLLGPRRTVRGTAVYTIPTTLQEDEPVTTLDKIREETTVLREASNEAERYLRVRAALEEQRVRLDLGRDWRPRRDDEAPAATDATDARVVRLDSRRRSA